MWPETGSPKVGLSAPRKREPHEPVAYEPKEIVKDEFDGDETLAPDRCVARSTVDVGACRAVPVCMFFKTEYEYAA